MGMAEADIDAELGPEEKDCEVWPENWPAVEAFLAVQTQWATGGMGGYTGLDYGRVRAGLALAGIAESPDLFNRLRVIERAVLKAIAAKEKASTPQ